jgi:hypothetical protein
VIRNRNFFATCHSNKAVIPRIECEMPSSKTLFCNIFSTLRREFPFWREWLGVEDDEGQAPFRPHCLHFIRDTQNPAGGPDTTYGGGGGTTRGMST